MASCKDCLYYEVCADFRRNICETDQKRFEEYKINSDGLCDNFKNKADFPKVKHGIWLKSLAGAYFCSNCGRNATYDFNKNQVLGIACAYCGIKIDGKEEGGD